jgi:hypothetical protein
VRDVDCERAESELIAMCSTRPDTQSNGGPNRERRPHGQSSPAPSI